MAGLLEHNSCATRAKRSVYDFKVCVYVNFVIVAAVQQSQSA